MPALPKTGKLYEERCESNKTQEQTEVSQQKTVRWRRNCFTGLKEPKIKNIFLSNLDRIIHKNYILDRF